jgi:hypothetical protein
VCPFAHSSEIQGVYVINQNVSTIRRTISLQNSAVLHRLSQITYAVDTRDVMPRSYTRPHDKRDDANSANCAAHTAAWRSRVPQTGMPNLQAVRTSRCLWEDWLWFLRSHYFLLPHQSRLLPSTLSPIYHSQPRLFHPVGPSSLAVTLRTTRFNIKKFYVVPTLRLCVLYRSQNKPQLLPYKTLQDWFL